MLVIVIFASFISTTFAVYLHEESLRLALVKATLITYLEILLITELLSLFSWITYRYVVGVWFLVLIFWVIAAIKYWSNRGFSLKEWLHSKFIHDKFPWYSRLIVLQILIILVFYLMIMKLAILTGIQF